MRGHIAVVGSVNMDMALRCAHLPRPGETVGGSGFSRGVGGKGANQAVSASRAGALVEFIGAIGVDSFGDEAAQCLMAERIGIGHLYRVAEPTGIAMIMVGDDSGQNCIALSPGANDALTVDRVEKAEDVISGASMLICQMETPLISTLRAMEIAKSARVPVLLNPAPVPLGQLTSSLMKSVLRLVDVLIPNESEAAALAGLSMQTEEDIVRVANALHQFGVGNVLITLGARGVLHSDGAVSQRYAANPVLALDTTSAGDTFIGALAASIGRGAELRDAIAWAQKAAALCVSRYGAMASIPFAHELPALITGATSVGAIHA
jgi:ribokinase